MTVRAYTRVQTENYIFAKIHTEMHIHVPQRIATVMFLAVSIYNSPKLEITRIHEQQNG